MLGFLIKTWQENVAFDCCQIQLSKSVFLFILEGVVQLRTGKLATCQRPLQTALSDASLLEVSARFCATTRDNLDSKDMSGSARYSHPYPEILLPL